MDLTVIALTDSSRARADRDHAHSAGLAELARPSPDVPLAAHLFAAAGAHARLTCRQLQEQAALVFVSLPRAGREIANPWEVDR